MLFFNVKNGGLKMDNEYRVLPASKVRSVVGLRRVQYRKVVWHTAELWVRTLLDTQGYNNLISSIVEYCGRVDDAVELAMVDFATKLNIIIAYALVDLPDDIDDMYRVIYDSDLFKTVCTNVNSNQIQSVLNFVNAYYGVVVG